MILLLMIQLWIGETSPPDLWPILDFQSSLPKGQDSIRFPVDFVFSPIGDLFVIDAATCQVHVWDANGNWIKSFAKKGQGPGELMMPYRLAFGGERCYVLDAAGQCSVFDLQGSYQRRFKLPALPARTFQVLENGTLVAGFQVVVSAREVLCNFVVLDTNGQPLHEIASFHNEMYLSPLGGAGKPSVKAFGPEIDIQKDDNNVIYVSFSQQPKVIQLDSQGNKSTTSTFELHSLPACAEEQEFVKDLRFGMSGSTFILNNNVKIEFAYPKAYFSNFLIKGQNVAFILHPIGSLNGLGWGFWKASYTICSRKTGQALATGKYCLPDDSQVLFKNGRIVAFIADENGDIAIKEMAMRGL